MHRNACFILILGLVQNFSVEGQSTFGQCELNDPLNFSDEIQNTVLEEIRHLQNQLRVCKYDCTQIEDLVGRHLNNITQNLRALYENVQEGIELNEDLQLKFRNLSSLYQEQVKVQQSVRRLLEEHDQYFRNQSAVDAYARQGVRGLELWPRDCADIRKVGQNVSDVYQVSSLGPGLIPNEISVYCDMNSSEASWLVFQRRKDGSENFRRTWLEYKNGFGNLRGEFWLGRAFLMENWRVCVRERIGYVARETDYKLRIELEDFEGNRRYAEYAQFSVGSYSDRYKLNVSGYTGDAGDDLEVHNGQIFSTMDADRNNCAKTFRGAWWYNSCHKSNLNGVYLRGNHTSYADGVEWFSFRGHYYSLKMTEMKIAPRD